MLEEAAAPRTSEVFIACDHYNRYTQWWRREEKKMNQNLIDKLPCPPNFLFSCEDLRYHTNKLSLLTLPAWDGQIPLIIFGPPGVGKKYLAKTLASLKPNKPLVHQNWKAEGGLLESQVIYLSEEVIESTLYPNALVWEMKDPETVILVPLDQISNHTKIN